MSMRRSIDAQKALKSDKLDELDDVTTGVELDIQYVALSCCDIRWYEFRIQMSENVLSANAHDKLHLVIFYY